MLFELFLLFLVNFLFGIAPLFVGKTPDVSTFALSFYRFFGATILELVIVTILFIIYYYRAKKYQPEFRFGRFIRKTLVKYYFARNQNFSNIPQFVYLWILGFLLINLSVPFYFLSFSVNGLVYSTIFVNACTLIIIALYNGVIGDDRLDVLKILDLTLLIAAILTIGFSNFDSSVRQFTIEGLGYIFIVILAYTLFLIWIGRDSTSKMQIIEEVKEEKAPLTQKDAKLERLSRIITSILKLIGIHSFGSIFLIPFTSIVRLITPESLLGHLSTQFLFTDLANFFGNLFSPSIIALIILASVIPYYILNYSVAIWPRNALSHDMWNSIFTLVDPLVGMYIGFLIWQEPIKPDYIIFTTLFLIAGIIIRYFHGSMNRRTFLFVIKLKKNETELFLEYIQKIREITQINRVLGTYDFVLHVTVQSMTKLSQITSKINYFPGLEKAYYSIEDPG
jgi:DNA-binding Lrp family transcriptional regulator/multidrug transporter EmrE-like cation transporter